MPRDAAAIALQIRHAAAPAPIALFRHFISPLRHDAAAMMPLIRRRHSAMPSLLYAISLPLPLRRCLRLCRYISLMLIFNAMPHADYAFRFSPALR